MVKIENCETVVLVLRFEKILVSSLFCKIRVTSFFGKFFVSTFRAGSNNFFLTQLSQKPFEAVLQDTTKDKSKLWGSLFSTSICQQHAFDYRLLGRGKQEFVLPVLNVRLISLKFSVQNV